MRPPTIRPWIVAAVAVATVGLPACGGDSGGPAATGDGTKTSPTRPEDVIAPMADVQAKLPALVTLGNTAKAQAAGGDFEAAADTLESLETLWFEVEGTVGDADRNAYEAAETAQGLMRDGVQTKKADRVAKGADDQARTLQQFLAAHR